METAALSFSWIITVLYHLHLRLTDQEALRHPWITVALGESFSKQVPALLPGILGQIQETCDKAFA